MRRVFVSLTLVLGLSTLPSIVHAQPTPPAPGVEMPLSVREHFRDKDAFTFGHAWLEKARIASENRERYIEERGFYKGDLMPAAQRAQYAVTGTLRVPVFCVKYSDSPPGDPFPVSQLQTKLFTGPFSPETLTQYYNDVSYGDINVTGTVYGWYTLAGTNAFYAGPGTCDGLGLCGKVFNLVSQTMAANDAAVNFGQYDNDGPDGVPNSGDDDGYVDFVALVQPESGAECGVTGNIWSHRSRLPIAYTTNDVRSGGGFIKVDDYVIMPIYNCDGTTLIDIGVFCHEFGHTFGLPDLYDADGGSKAVGDWCLMAHGGWTTTSRPVHMGAYSKTLLGWTNVVTAPGSASTYNIADVETHRTVYRMDNSVKKWRWIGCFLGDEEKMRCLIQVQEANNRNWAAGAGYGDYWDATVSRQFQYNGSGTVTLEYGISYALEPNYDYGDATITVGNTTTTFATYNGVGDEDGEPYNLTPYMPPGGGPYTISFHVLTDVSNSDEDGVFPTTCGAMSLGYVTLNGGGENYFTTFADREDGWAASGSPPEYYLVENRQPIGSDANVPGSGLVVWHIDQGTQYGGASNNQPRGVEIEQADGLGNLEANINNGDAGDPFPGSSNKLLFTQGTNPSSFSHSGTNPVWMQVLSGNGNPISAQMYSLYPVPYPESVVPATGTSGLVVQLQIDGEGFLKTPTAELVPHIPDDEAGNLVLDWPSFTATKVEWIGHDRIVAKFHLTQAPNGLYDIVVHNPGGNTSVLPAEFTVTGATPTGAGDVPHKFELSPNYPNPFNPSTTIRYQIPSRAHVELRVYDVSGAVVRTLVDGTKPAGSYSLTWNGLDDRGNQASSGVYFYRITAGDFSDVRKMTLLK